MERSLFCDCLGVGSVAPYAKKERGCFQTENSACQAIYNVGWFCGCANALPTAKTTLEIILGHTGSTAGLDRGVWLGRPTQMDRALGVDFKAL